MLALKWISVRFLRVYVTTWSRCSFLVPATATQNFNMARIDATLQAKCAEAFQKSEIGTPCCRLRDHAISRNSISVSLKSSAPLGPGVGIPFRLSHAGLSSSSISMRLACPFLELQYRGRPHLSTEDVPRVFPAQSGIVPSINNLYKLMETSRVDHESDPDPVRISKPALSFLALGILNRLPK